jgi:folylpolyglutamate synthase/dihydropteroate synthase
MRTRAQIKSNVNKFFVSNDLYLHEILKTKFNKENSRAYGDYKEAFEEAKKEAKKEDMVLITGSAFLIGDILNEFY